MEKEIEKSNATEEEKQWIEKFIVRWGAIGLVITSIEVLEKMIEDRKGAKVYEQLVRNLKKIEF